MKKNSLDRGRYSTPDNRHEVKQVSAGRVLRSGELAELAGISRDTLRHYERHGLLPSPPRSANRYRVYPPEACARVKLIRAALSIGFTVEELGEILRARDKGAAPCRQVHDLATQKLAMLEARVQELSALRDQLRAALRSWKRTLGNTKPGARAGLLELFAASHPESTRALSPLLAPQLRQKFAKRRSSNERM